MNHEIDTETYTLIARDKKNEHLIFLISRRAVIKKFFFSQRKIFYLYSSRAREFLLKFSRLLFKIALKNFYANNEIEFTQRHVNSVPYSSNILHMCMKKIYNPVITLVYTFNCFDIQFQYIFYELRNYKYIRFPCHFPFFKWFVRQLSRAFRAQMHKDHLSLYTFIQLLDSTYDCSSLKFLLFS